MIGTVAGSAVMYQAMSELGHAGESGYTGPLKLSGDSKGTSVLILGAGLAGMSAALELRNAGYSVRILEYNDRPGGRNWSLYGGDTYTEMGGLSQKVQFAEGLYLNPGPWRIPYHHHALLDYCKRLKVQLEPFTQVNYAAYMHSSKAFGGKPQRYREVHADFNGHVAELLAKAAHQGQLDQGVTREDREVLLEAMREWGALDNSYEYK
jgi:monoamine oxidase